jgi:hypothetical protein
MEMIHSVILLHRVQIQIPSIKTMKKKEDTLSSYRLRGEISKNHDFHTTPTPIPILNCQISIPLLMMKILLSVITQNTVDHIDNDEDEDKEEEVEEEEEEDEYDEIHRSQIELVGRQRYYYYYCYYNCE